MLFRIFCRSSTRAWMDIAFVHLCTWDTTYHLAHSTLSRIAGRSLSLSTPWAHWLSFNIRHTRSLHSAGRLGADSIWECQSLACFGLFDRQQKPGLSLPLSISDHQSRNLLAMYRYWNLGFVTTGRESLWSQTHGGTPVPVHLVELHFCCPAIWEPTGGWTWKYLCPNLDYCSE